MPTLTLDQLIILLTRYVTETGEMLDLLLIGALALPAYGISGRATHDVDAEVVGSIGRLLDFLTKAQIPADLTQNFSGWSIVAMPPGYRDRSTILVDQPNLRIRILTPIDFVLAKLRRGTDVDFEDALLVVQQNRISSADIRTASQSAITASPQDTALFLFRKTVELFCQNLPEITEN
ncbi:MAG TPA: DUF6036 family nucleotidyltransferase [Nitrospira sp.]|nr:DUF6036 family nucleotidyltransferase [Nitrospira sp.]